MQVAKQEILNLEQRYRANLINSITGFKSLSLICTINSENVSNVAVFTQVLHVGAHPPLIGVLFRPVMEGMDTMKNIMERDFFTLNHVPASLALEAHWTSAKWKISEFEGVGLEEEYIAPFPVPFVKGAPIQMGLKFVEKHLIAANQTTFLVGSIEYLSVPDAAIEPDGFIDLAKTGSLAGVGLDGYYKGEKLHRFSYAKPGIKPEII